MPQLEHDSRFTSIDERERNSTALVDILERLFATKPRTEWLKAFDDEDVVCGPVNGYGAVVRDPQVLENGYLATTEHPNAGTIPVVTSPVRLSATAPTPAGYAPELGQQTEEVLLDLGYTWAEIEALRVERVI